MAGTPKCLFQFAMGSAIITAYTVSASKRVTVSHIHVHNTDSVQRTFRVHHVLSGESVDVKNRIVPDSALPSADFVEFFGGAVLAAGDTIQCYADATGVVGIAVYGIEESV